MLCAPPTFNTRERRGSRTYRIPGRSFVRKTSGLWKPGAFRIVPMTLTPALKALYRFPRVRPNSGFKPKVDMSEVHLKKGEPVDKALRRLKKKLDREQTLVQVRLHRRFEKPSAKRRRKEKAARFTAMLKARYADV